MKRFVSLLAALLLFFSAAAQAEGTLRVAVRQDVAGFSYYNAKSGSWSGFEVDLAQLLARALGYQEVAFVPVEISDREPALRNGEADMVIATFSITQTRAERLHFSPAYFREKTQVVVENSTMFDELSDLKGMRIGVIISAVNAEALVNKLAEEGIIPKGAGDRFDASSFDGGVHFRVYRTYNELFQALELGEVDAACVDTWVVQSYMTSGRSFLPEVISTSDYGVALMPDSPLCDRVDQLISGWLEDGTIASLISKWELDEKMEAVNE